MSGPGPAGRVSGPGPAARVSGPGAAQSRKKPDRSHVKRYEGAPAEEPVRPTRISFQDGGSMAIMGDLRLDLGDGEQIETRATVCLCGKSGNRPFCDLACRES